MTQPEFTWIGSISRNRLSSY